jgi:NTE family protein
MSDRALVLGGGGVTGRAWELGVLTGLLDAGIDLTVADLVVGTSAGSAVGALVTAAGSDLRALYQRELAGPGPGELVGRFGPGLFVRWFGIGLAGRSGTAEELGRAFGRLAVASASRTVSQEQRVADLATRMGVQEWPLRRLLITAVDADTGALVVFDAGSGVRILDAVAASCAVPGVWPLVTVNGRRCIDGGMRSPANADLAAGCGRVVVLAPNPRGFRLESAAAVLVAGVGEQAVVIVPDQAARRAFGRKLFDPAGRAPAARAGYAQAAAEAERVAVVWGR